MIARLKKRLYLVVAAYFRLWANLSFRRWQPQVIAVTGSVGKTTMLRLIEIQLGKAAHYSHNANSAFGIAFDIVGLPGVTNTKWRWAYLFVAVPIRALWFKHREQYYVVEIDGERPKETEFLASWLRPEVTLWVSLGRSHAVFYDEQVKAGLFQTVDEAIAHEFGYLPRLTKQLVIAEGDSPLISSQLEGISAKVEKVWLKDLVSYSVYPEGSVFELADKKISFTSPMPREVTIQLLMLEKLTAYLKLELKTDFAEFKPAPGRNNFLKGKNGLRMIDSSYNAHLISMKSMLEMMQAMKAPHTWLVISDITEQGEDEANQHALLGEALAATSAERYIIIGRRTAKHTAPVLKRAGHDKATIVCDDAKQALAYLEANLTGQETIMFKGSQYLEWIIEKLLDNPDDRRLLARQEPAAVKRRAEWGLK